MWRFLMLFILICVFKQSKGEEFEDLTSKETSVNDIEKTIRKIERLTIDAEKTRRERIVPMEDTEKLYDKIARLLGDLTELIAAKNNTYTFFKLHGVDTVIIPNIRTTYVSLRGQLLNLIKTLFNSAPTTTNTLLPINIVDMLLDVFENDDNLALKAHALDILFFWLPNNPKLQARVMKVKGLEPFYRQISKLDSEVVFKMLDLFNTVLEEHLAARNKDQRNRIDYENFRMYQMIGLIERMSTVMVCDGLLNIFKVAVTFSENAEEVLAPVFKLMKNIKPYCIKLYKSKESAVDIFNDMHKYIRDNKDINFEALGLNYTEIEFILNDYIEQLRENYKDEL
ncbi:uncharacterized protein LOC123720216 [Pieris brassicae]|uniref:Uncharacterized protein n=1 Tax=Pieris brassicae TaxID=7116 RepID=A0A9P0XJS3_PIEBR|nr:uncharacterized protein LOC123720216 [Pieris brassicae]CAH4037032.1 unnamed protein product [Pieris brassicae]